MTITITDFLEYLTGQVDGQPWRDQANCKGMGPERFFPQRGESSTQARAVCACCPVRQECHDYSQATPERFGVWAGLSERERRRERRGHLKVVA